MSNLPLPEKSVTYSSKGFSEIYERFRSDGAVVELIAKEFEADPKRVIHHVFVTTDKQRAAIESRTDEELRELAQLLLDQLRSGAPDSIEFYPSIDEQDNFRPRTHVGGCFK